MKNQYQFFCKWLILTILVMGMMPGIVFSQEESTCAEKLRNAELLFERGQVEQVPEMLAECMRSGFNREESLSAYKLLIQAFLFEDKLEMADSTMLAFLKKNPEYEVSPTDHSSFVNLFNSFKVKPVLQLSVHFGTNIPFLTFVDNRSTTSIDCENTYSSDAINLFASLEAKFRLAERLEINVEPGFSQLSFENVEEFMDFKRITYSETQNRLELPVTITYSFVQSGRFSWYGRIGPGVAMNISTTATPIYDAVDINNPNSYAGANISRNDSRIKYDLFAQAGTGVKFKTSGGFLFLEIRSNLGVFNQVVRGEASSQELKWLYNYEDDDFYFNAANINIGYTQIFYKPSKRKE